MYDAATGEQMYSQVPGFEQRLADLEAQIDRLSVTLHHWRDTQEHLQPMEHRLSHLTEQCAQILERWSATGERHAHVVGELEAQLSGWNDVETRLTRDASSRFQALERAIEHEWAALRRLHEEPARQLRAQAESLTEICVATAGSAQTGLERAEARLGALESDLHRRMAELSRDVLSAVAELRHKSEVSTLRGAATPWPLDEVARLHNELRENTNPRPGGIVDQPDGSASLALRPQVTFGAAADTRADSIGSQPEQASEAAATGFSARRIDLRWTAVVAVLALGLVAAAVFAFSFYRQVGVVAARATDAQQQAARTAAAANQQIEAAQATAARQIEQARNAALKAQTTSDVLAAPDLVRYNLVGGDAATRFSAQLLWSRSRGVVFSASRLPALPSGTIYQIWLVSSGAPVSAGTFEPDSSGRVTITTDTPPNAPRPLTGVVVTLEPAPGRPAPSGQVVLSRVQ